MNPDELQHAWQSPAAQPRITINAELLQREVVRNKKSFATAILWRDVREIGVSFVMIPAWIYLGIMAQLPWTWYLMLPALVWVPGFMLWDRQRQRRQSLLPEESLRHQVESSLAAVEHQIWLLKNIFWWYIFPFVPPMAAFLLQMAWTMREGGWAALAIVVLMALSSAAITLYVYSLNQRAVLKSLEPRRQELLTLHCSLVEVPLPPENS